MFRDKKIQSELKVYLGRHRVTWSDLSTYHSAKLHFEVCIEQTNFGFII